MKDIESVILRLHTTKRTPAPCNSIWDLPPAPTTQVPEPEPTEPTSDPTPYITALLSVLTTPTESSAVDDQVIEEWPALPEVSFAISSLFSVSIPTPAPVSNPPPASVSKCDSASVSNSTSDPVSNPTPAPVSNSKIRLPGTKNQTKGQSRKRAVGSLQFKRSAYSSKDNRNLELVHYEGDETVYVPVAHGNSKKDNASEYTRTASSVLKTIEDQVKSGEKNTMEIYRDNISDNSIPGIQQGVLNARNVKQVETIVLKVNEQKRISKDDL